jgi:Na+-transporting NADH:ubiquinone oxidoreductase subunit NqrB
MAAKYGVPFIIVLYAIQRRLEIIFAVVSKHTSLASGQMTQTIPARQPVRPYADGM